MSMESAKTRLHRLLIMVPWVLEHPGEPIEVVAATFGITPRQVEKDLSIIFLCGTPGITPDVLIEAEWESGEVFIRNADEISRPLRLGPDEALSLIVALRALRGVPGLADPEVVDSALAKLAGATGYSGGDDTEALSRRIGVDLADEDAARWLGVLRSAVTDQRRVHLRYLNPARDELTERDVDPIRVERSGAHWYLRGWCHRATDVRTFRLDRIDDLHVYDVEGIPPSEAQTVAAGPTYRAAPGAMEVTLRVAPSARWIAEYYPVRSVEELPGTVKATKGPGGTAGSGTDEPGLLITLEVGDPAWVRRLMWQLGGAAEVVAPAHLGHDVLRGAERALDAYGDLAPL